VSDRASPARLEEATDWIDERSRSPLARQVPEHVHVPMAVDVARNWVLLPDGGASSQGSQSRLNPPRCGCHISSPSCCVNSIFSSDGSRSAISSH
jgi:hypothetical protein